MYMLLTHMHTHTHTNQQKYVFINNVQGETCLKDYKGQDGLTSSG